MQPVIYDVPGWSDIDVYATISCFDNDVTYRHYDLESFSSSANGGYIIYRYEAGTQRVLFDPATGLLANETGTQVCPQFEADQIGITNITDDDIFPAVYSSSGGGGSSSPYIIDLGSTLMLGAMLTVAVAFWFVKLARSKKTS